MTYTPDLIRTIARNRGKVPKHVMANSLGISVSFLERIAREHGLDLRLIDVPPLDPFRTGTANNPEARRLDRHSESVTTAFMPHDLVLIDKLAAKYGIARARVVSRIIENARARDVIDELAKLPAPLPTAHTSPSVPHHQSPVFPAPEDSSVNPRNARCPQGAE